MTDDSESIDIAVPQTIAELYTRYEEAKAARAQWADEEKSIKVQILNYLGYEGDDEEPKPVRAVAPSGVPLFKVTIGSWKGLDFNYLRTNHPDVYAASERTKPTMALKSA